MSLPPRPDPIERDPALDAAWKAHSTELPPPRVDAAILAAAHRESRSRPRAAGDDDAGARARGPSRAWWGLAAAATIGAIAFGIVQVAPERETEVPATVASDTPSVVQERPAPAPASEPVGERKADAPPVARDDAAAAPIAPALPKPAAPKAVRREQRPAEPVTTPAPVPIAPPTAFAPQPFPAMTQALPAFPPAEPLAKREAEGVRADEQSANQLTRQRSAAKLAAGAPKGAEAREALGSGSDAARAPRPPAAWIEATRELYAAQRFADAARELNAFRTAYADADARLPESLRSWAETVKRD